MPTATYAPEGRQPRMYTQADTELKLGLNEGKPRLSGIWWFAIIGPFVLVPLVVGGLWAAAGVRTPRGGAARARAEVRRSSHRRCGRAESERSSAVAASGR